MSAIDSRLRSGPVVRVRLGAVYRSRVGGDPDGKRGVRYGVGRHRVDGDLLTRARASVHGVRRFHGWFADASHQVATGRPPSSGGAGGVMLLMGAAMITGDLTALSYWLLEAFPGLANIG